jgi:hypothetical protein
MPKEKFREIEDLRRIGSSAFLAIQDLKHKVKAHLVENPILGMRVSICLDMVSIESLNLNMVLK